MLSINPFILFVNSSLTPTFSLRKEKVGPKETNCGAAVFIWVEKFLRRGDCHFGSMVVRQIYQLKNLIEKYFSLDKMILTC
jgi:hypothetical protein